jgi:toxin ParE1/3/4
MRHELSPLARTDLKEIGDYIARDNPHRAISFVEELVGQCQKLAGNPGIGAPRPELAEGLRMLPHGRYLIFYRVDDEVLRIVRVLHSARDLGPLFHQ